MDVNINYSWIIFFTLSFLPLLLKVMKFDSFFKKYAKRKYDDRKIKLLRGKLTPEGANDKGLYIKQYEYFYFINELYHGSFFSRYFIAYAEFFSAGITMVYVYSYLHNKANWVLGLAVLILAVVMFTVIFFIKNIVLPAKTVSPEDYFDIFIKKFNSHLTTDEYNQIKEEASEPMSALQLIMFPAGLFLLECMFYFLY